MKKTCKDCGETKPLSSYYKDKRGKYGVYARCKPCHGARTKKWSESNPDYYGKYREENREKLNAYHSAYSKENPQYKARWAKKNPEKRAVVLQRRRARQANVVNDFTIGQWNECVAHFDGACAYCGDASPLAQEHVVPVASQGGYTRSNIVPACKTCNSSKNAREMSEWFRAQPFFDKSRLDMINQYLEEGEAESHGVIRRQMA